MSFSIGIVGLPNVGKSTTFNALTQTQQAEVENYPFCTIEPNRAVVPVPDARLEMLQRLVDVRQRVPATVEFVDIAGLVQGASQGEGLGNQFLAQIRDTAAIAHVVRCFDDENIVHVNGRPDPAAEIDLINLELVTADWQQLERKIERLAGQAKADKAIRPTLTLAQDLAAFLDSGRPVAAYPDQDNPIFQELVHELRFLTTKPVIYIANVAEADLPDGNDYVAQVRRIAAEQEAAVVLLCAQLEAELATLTAEERAEYLELAGITADGLDQVIQQGYRALGLISFFTRNEREVRAWEIPGGWTAPQAAGTIHTDFEHGFIKAEVVPYETFVQHGSMAAARAAGELRQEGRDYVVADGDVVYFRFNV